MAMTGWLKPSFEPNSDCTGYGGGEDFGGLSFVVADASDHGARYGALDIGGGAEVGVVQWVPRRTKQQPDAVVVARTRVLLDDGVDDGLGETDAGGRRG